jgi:hypothetical protein
MKRLFRRTRSLVLSTLCAGLALPAGADIIFNNTTTSLGRHFDPGTLQVGDEILLAGTARYLSTFSFEYWGTSSTPGAFAGSVNARIRFYVNDGALQNGYPAPDTIPFYDSGWLSNLLTPTTASTVVFTAGTDFPGTGLAIPASDITWSIQFRGLGQGDALGLNLYSPPTVGSDYPDYWQDDGGWLLMTNIVSMDFGAKFEASVTVVPEPSVVGLLLFGGMTIVAVMNRRRQQ